MQRKLTVILSVDVVGHGGRIFKLMGDGALIEFPSAASAAICALEIQHAMEETAVQQSEVSVSGWSTRGKVCGFRPWEEFLGFPD